MSGSDMGSGTPHLNHKMKQKWSEKRGNSWLGVHLHQHMCIKEKLLGKKRGGGSLKRRVVSH